MEGFTCVADPSSSMGGICQTYYDGEEKKNNDNEEVSSCLRSCLEQLQLDENFLFESTVNVQWMGPSSDVATSGSRPNGCIVRYQRKKITDLERRTKKVEDLPLEKWWHNARAHRIVRIDPFLANPTDQKDHPQEWMALCYNPCLTNEDCINTKGFQCHEQLKVCRRREDDYWTPTEETRHDLVFLSAANDSYFEALKNLAASLRYWAPQHKLVVYNLGLSQERVAEMQKPGNPDWSNLLKVQWEKGIPSHYPPHISVGKKYAWKPLAINESLHEHHSVFWLDAGSTMVGNWTEALRIVRQTGIFLVKGQDLDMKARSHQDTYRYLGHHKGGFAAGPHFSGNTQAYLHPSRYTGPLVEANALCALDADCIAPKGSSLSNHRYDQTTMSILAYRDHLQIPHHTEFLAAERKQLQPSMLNSSFKFVWTSRGSTDFYYRHEHESR